MNKKKGVSLVAAIAIMLITAVLSVTLVSMLGVTSRGGVDYLRSSQAFGLAQGGLNWYMMQLSGIANWTSGATDQTAVSLGPGQFDVTVSNKASAQDDSTTATRLDVSIAGKVTGNDAVTIQRTMSQRAFKFPSASRFALFWGRRTGTALTLTNTTVSGDFWSQGSCAIPSGSNVTQGRAYRPSTEDITGAGSYIEQSITYAANFGYFGNNDPAFTSTFSTPTLLATYYTDLLNTYNSVIATSPANKDLSRSSGNFNVSGTMRYRNVSITGSTTIVGNGTLIANGTSGNGVMTLGSTSGGPVTIRPDAGGSITFLARRNFTVNNVTIDNSNNPAPDYYPRVRMYTQAAGGTGDLLTIQNSANLDRAFLLTDRRILVQKSSTSPVITNSVFFVNNNASSATNNNLTVTGNGTVVGNSGTGPCSLLSIARGAPALAITTTTGTPAAAVRGLIYQRDSGNAGFTNISGIASARVNITGSIIANQFTGNAMSNANITYDPAAIPDPPPEGFNNFAAKAPDSWSGI